MKISEVVHEHGEIAPARATITIEIEPGDDPDGFINGLILRERLDAVLSLVGRGSDAAETRGDVAHLLVRGRSVSERLDASIEGVMWVARDTLEMTWKEIADAAERPKGSVRSIVERVRRARADQGYWRDAEGLHHSEDVRYAHFRAMARASDLFSIAPPADDE